MSDNTIKVEVNGVELDARPGEMLIAVTDRAGIYVPRFCYHEKLSVAANCRMCLVEVVNAPKPLPACATPVTSGMKVSTRSPRAIGAQKATMEFLLINHPLDCPICDQGGECELQDLAMGFGRDVSRFNERKRVVRDKNIGPLISTDMTRCIHCTRCVRFGQEIAGIQELGTIGRGERMQISTFVERSVDHELSGNIIDLCPVGALNSKPYRFSARAWEMQSLPTVAAHDCVGSNLSAHVLLGRVKRVVPRANEAINETWLADRDRFSYEGIYAGRVEQPMIRDGGPLRPASWEEALEAAAAGLSRSVSNGGAGIGAWAAPTSTVEEGYLLQRLFRHLGSDNVDHRLRRRDFRLQDRDPAFPWLGLPLAELEQADAIVVVGSNLRREAPLIAHRVRKAALRGASVVFVNPARYEYLHPVAGCLETGLDLVGGLRRLLSDSPDAEASAVLGRLRGAARPVILLGQIAGRHPRLADLRQAAGELARQYAARIGYVSEGPNSAGLALAGVLPHRGPGGSPLARAGRNLAEMQDQSLSGLVLLNVEPEHDCADGERAVAAVAAAGFVLALSPYLSPALEAHADVVLPVGTFAETAGTFVNCEGRWQSFNGVAAPVGGSRPAWKVLRVLGNLLQVPDFDYASAADVCAVVHGIAGAVQPDNTVAVTAIPPAATAVALGPGDLDVPMYRTDGVLRRAAALQQTREARG
ncbi:MAG: NADH-quinone oxidoreductase subunit G [Chromatiales bacterium]|nr:NADH-quinone oxidoreductase subunit G [Chromatiales bacterium]